MSGSVFFSSTHVVDMKDQTIQHINFTLSSTK